MALPWTDVIGTRPELTAIGAVLGVVPEQEHARPARPSMTRFSTVRSGRRGSEAATMSPGRTDLRPPDDETVPGLEGRGHAQPGDLHPLEVPPRPARQTSR